MKKNNIITDWLDQHGNPEIDKFVETQLMQNKMKSEETKQVIIRPGFVGGYRLGNLTHNYIQFDMTYKPKWIHRQMMRIFFGWYWVDNNF